MSNSVFVKPNINLFVEFTNRNLSQKFVEHGTFSCQPDERCRWRDSNSQPLAYKSRALAIELYSSKAIAGKELRLSSWCIASLYTVIISQLWLTSHPRSTVVLLDSGTPATSREIYSEDADGETRTRNPSVIN